MTCDEQAPRLTWEVQLHEPFSNVWICRWLGRASTSAEPTDVARAVLAGYLAATPPRPGDTFRAVAYTETTGPVFVTTRHLKDDGWMVDQQICAALPTHLRDALAAAG